jgi:FdhD protein
MQEDSVASDKTICLFINGEYYRTFIATPSLVEELVMGHLFTEGIIKSMDELKEFKVKSLRANVELTSEINLNLLNMSKVDLITTACGSLTPSIRADRLDLPKNTSGLRVMTEVIWDMVRELNLRSKVHTETGGTHSAMLCSKGGTIIAFAEDVGRHNAIDKVIGACLLRGINFRKCVLVSSGRQSGEMVLKAARSGIPLIVAIAGPLESGIRLAEAAGITLICFVRGRHMNLYTHPERIILDIAPESN